MASFPTKGTLAVASVHPNERGPPMVVLQVVPIQGRDAFRLLRARIRGASTWVWSNKAKTRLKHVQRPKGGHITITNADGVLVARVEPKTTGDLFYLAEKFIGRLVAWF